MGETFKKTTQTIKKLDPDLVSFALSGVVIGIVTYKPEYADQLEAAFVSIKKILSKEDLTEDELHGVIQKTIEDIGVNDPQAQVMIKLFLKKLDNLAEKYLDVVEGEFTEEEKEAWSRVFDDLIDTLKMYNRTRVKTVSSEIGGSVK